MRRKAPGNVLASPETGLSGKAARSCGPDQLVLRRAITRQADRLPSSAAHARDLPCRECLPSRLTHAPRRVACVHRMTSCTGSLHFHCSAICCSSPGGMYLSKMPSRRSRPRPSIWSGWTWLLIPPKQHRPPPRMSGRRKTHRHDHQHRRQHPCRTRNPHPS